MPTTYSLVSLFAGIGGIEKGFEATGRFKTLGANELDDHACESYRHNHLDGNLVKETVYSVSGEKLKGNGGSSSINVLTAGFPCQPFSIAGYRKGFDDPRGNVFWQIIRLINELRPDVVLLENVKNLEKHDDGKTLKTILSALKAEVPPEGYPVGSEKIYQKYYFPAADENGKVHKILNASKFGIPQNRERIFIVAFKNDNVAKLFQWPESSPSGALNLGDFINFAEDKDKKFQYLPSSQYYKTLNDEVKTTGVIYQLRRHYVRENKSGLCPTLTANMGMGGHNVPLIRTTNNVVRKLTPQECFNLMGYPDFKFHPDLPMSAFYKQAGNAVVVPVITALASSIVSALDARQNFGENFWKRLLKVFSLGRD